LGDAIYANPLLLGFAWQKGWIPLSCESLIRAIELNGIMVEKNRLAFDWGRTIAHRGAQAVAPELNEAQTTAHVIPMPETLDQLVERNVRWLTAYQNRAYAQKFRDAVDRVRQKEAQIDGGRGLRLTRTVAKNLAKLMAYKDEYEVARLYVDPVFMDKLRAQFEGEPGKDYALHFHLAPPLFSKKDEHGRLVKRKYGPWVLGAFRVLARLKGLRGTALDPFGRTMERRQERELVREYFELIDEWAVGLTSANLAAAIELAGVPDDIRGFGHVKERNVQAARVRRAELLASYRV
jgi:indolepyruvate ferredoxin oxidoreductase